MSERRADYSPRLKLAPLVGLLATLVAPLPVPRAAAGEVTAWPAPAGEELSDFFTLKAEGQFIPVYAAKVASADRARRMKAMDDKVNSADYFDKAAFASFDMKGAVKLTVTCREPVKSVRVLPSSFHLTPSVDGNTVTLILADPRPVTIEVNGNWVRALHVFANPPEAQPPRAGDPGVLYYGPGVHELSEGVTVGNGTTVYVAGGAVVKGKGRGGPVFLLKGTNITLRGRGIIDGSLCPTHSRNLVKVEGAHIVLEGVILRDSSIWTVPIRKSDRVSVKNLKLIGYRANSDGIDICNSRDVTVDGCFIRTLDDLIVVKSDKGQGEVRRIAARNCVLWNEVAHALSVGAELRENVDDVLFTDCDVIHDKGREWTLRVFHCDAARISNVRFEDLRIEESPRLISLWIGKFVWTRDEERGQIRDVSFRNIAASADPLHVELKGYDAGHTVENVVFDRVTVNGRPLAPADVRANEFVRNVRIEPR